MSGGIRDITEADITPLVALWIEAWNPVLPQIDFASRTPFILERLNRFMHPPNRARMIDGEGFYLLDPFAGELEQVAVLPRFWGKGVADIMLSDAKALSRTYLRLSVNRDNPRALAFYKRHGFYITGESTSAASGLPVLMMEWRSTR